MTTLPRTLPASWYRSSPLYQLERRAVFLRSWYLLGPVIKFSDDAVVDYEFAGVFLRVSRDTAGGDVQVHDGAETPLRSHTTSTGLLFSTISDDAPPFEEFFPGLEEILSTVDFTKRPYRRSIQYEGHFNWKTMVDGYQE